MSKSIEDLQEEIEILKGYKHMYEVLNKKSEQYQKTLLEITTFSRSAEEYQLMAKRALEEQK